MADVNKNTKLHTVGASYEVKKLTTDAPHWSHDGHEMRSMKAILHAAIVFLIVASCSPASEPAQKTAAPFEFNKQIGWLHGPCLAIAAPELAGGTPVTLVVAAEPQKVQQARIQGKTESSATCPALMEGRGKLNAKPGLRSTRLGPRTSRRQIWVSEL